MFEDSLVESSGALSRRNPWTVALSFVVQGLLAGMLLLLPLIYTEALPWRQVMNTLVEPAPPAGPASPPPAQMHSSKQRPTLVDNTMRVPRSIPEHIALLQEESPNADGREVPGGFEIPGGIAPTVPNSIISSILQGAQGMPKVALPSKVRVSSGVVQGLLIHETRPVYPALALQARVQGSVLLQAVIAKDGTVRDLQVVSGHPLLMKAALDAVKSWRYKPYLLNGQPVEIDTQITVNFTLANR